MNLIESFGKEAAIALVFGFITTRIVTKGRKSIAPPMKALSSEEASASASASASATKEALKRIDASEAFTNDELSDLTSVWQDDKLEGKFLKGRHGTTHYIVDRNCNSSNSSSSESNDKGMVVLGHGLGSSLKMFQELSDILVDKGYTVLRYDCFGHGYSKYNGEDMWIKYDPDTFVDQLEDLLDFVCEEENEKVVAFVGHCNGGVNGISANYRWSSSNHENNSKRSVFPKMILVSPALYAKKPLLARISDSIPTVMISLMKTIPAMQALIGDNYLELMTQVFGKNEKTKEYNHPEKFKQLYETNLRLFGRVEGVKPHPFLAAAILGVSSYNIPGSMLPLHREKFTKLLGLSGENKSDHLVLWGDLDNTIPFKENVDDIRNLVKEHSSNLRLEVLHNLCHEVFVEDTPAVAEAMLPFLDSD